MGILSGKAILSLSCLPSFSLCVCVLGGGGGGGGGSKLIKNCGRRQNENGSTASP